MLEVGRNAGTNVNRLGELGFHDLTGIEINANALTSVDVFADMARVARFVCMIELESASNRYVESKAIWSAPRTR